MLIDFRELLRKHPFLRILLPLIIGILTMDEVEVSTQSLPISLFVGLAMVFAFVMLPGLRKSIKLRYVHGLLVFSMFVSLGAFRIQTVKDEMLISPPGNRNFFLLELLENPVEKEKSWTCAAKICGSVVDDKLKEETARLILYFEKGEKVGELKTGDRLLMDSKLNRVRNTGNPFEFDYAAYLKTRHILYSSYLKEKQWIKIEENAWNVKALAWKWRDQLLQTYRENGIRDESFDILAALTLGYKTGLDPEVKKAWADAGAMHVLAVSGLHVGIIYMVMNYLLAFLSKLKYGTWIRTVILLFILCLYALLTGLSPSVLRATCMFAFIAIAEALKRKGGIFNSLAASAFFLLFYDPYLLFTVGFQFSYLAVAGIVLLQPQLDKLLYFRNHILNKFWQLTTVALAAQIATFPLTIYYFNQFPTYFLLSGYVVILMAGILIYLSALLLVLSQLEFISNILGWILQELVGMLNKVILSIHHLPGAVLHDISFSFHEVLKLYLILFTLIFILIVKRKNAVFVLLILLIGYQLPVLQQLFQPERKEIIIFNAGRNSLIAFRQGKNVCYLNDEKMDSLKFQFLTHNYQIKNKLHKITTDTIQEIDFRRFGNRNILIIGKSKNIDEELVQSLQPDIILFRKSGLKSYELLTKHSTVSTFVVDASVYDRDLKRLHKKKQTQWSNLFVIKDSGAYRIDLSSQK